MSVADHLELIRQPTRKSTWAWLGVAVVCTFGMLLPVLALLFVLAWWFDDPPRSFDRAGMVTRKRRCLRWADVTQTRGCTEYRRRHGRVVPVRRYVRIEFNPGKAIHFEPDLFENGGAALAFLERMLATKIEWPHTVAIDNATAGRRTPH